MAVIGTDHVVAVPRLRIFDCDDIVSRYIPVHSEKPLHESATDFSAVDIKFSLDEKRWNDLQMSDRY